MIVVYHCRAGTYFSIIAAMLHAGLSPAEHLPSRGVFERLVFYDQRTANYGKICKAGTDGFGNAICFMGGGSACDIAIKAVKGIGMLYGVDPERIRFVDLTPCVNVIMLWGSYVVWKLHLIILGKPLLTCGTRQCYGRIVRLVENTQKELPPV